MRKFNDNDRKVKTIREFWRETYCLKSKSSVSVTRHGRFVGFSCFVKCKVCKV